MPTDCCARCLYSQGPIPAGVPDAGQYLCRRYPPDGNVSSGHSPFPMVTSDVWCGDHKHGTPDPL